MKSLPIPILAKCLSHAGFSMRVSPPEKSWVLALEHMKHDPAMLAEWLIKRFGDRDSAMVKAVRFNDAAFIKALGGPAHEDAVDAAVYGGYANALDALIAAGAVCDDDALIAAASRGHTDVVATLLKAGSRAVDDALKQAARFGHSDVVQLLLDAGADVHAGKDFALVNAVAAGRVSVVKLLLSAGADVHASDDDALKRAAWAGRNELVQILLDAGAHVHADTLELATEAGCTDTVLLLQRARM